MTSGHRPVPLTWRTLVSLKEPWASPVPLTRRTLVCDLGTSSGAPDVEDFGMNALDIVRAPGAEVFILWTGRADGSRKARESTLHDDLPTIDATYHVTQHADPRYGASRSRQQATGHEQER